MSRPSATREPAAHPTNRVESTRADADELLAGLVRETRERAVILFVGSGISAGLGLPTWEDFIGRLGGDVGFAPDEFLALSSDFRSLAEFYRLEKGSLEAPCGKMAREWRVGDERLASSAVHRLIVRLDFPIVYTTNYDHLLERAYRLEGRRFNKIVTAKDIARSDPTLPSIVKFHGDLDDPASMVLAETDYIRRLSFEQPLDIKLAADALGKAVLFVGYSVSDINLRVLLYRLQEIWRASGCEDYRPRSYVLMTKGNQVQERILDSWGVAPLIATHTDETKAVARFLELLSSADRPLNSSTRHAERRRAASGALARRRFRSRPPSRRALLRRLLLEFCSLRKLRRSGFSVPPFERLVRNLALREELGELAALRLALERHPVVSAFCA